MRPGPRWAALALLALAIAIPARAAAQEGEPEAQPVPRDTEFGITPRHRLGLERQVRMYQWRATGDGFAGTWSAEPIDSSSFPPQYRNPDSLPLSGARWMPERITVDGMPISAEAIQALGEWRDLRPDFAALPGNLAATFQPEGNGLGSAENPLDPQIGDLRIQWRELVLPALRGRLVLREGRWHLPDPAQEAGEGAPGDAPAVPAQGASRAWGAWWIAGGLLVLLLGGLVGWRRR